MGARLTPRPLEWSFVFHRRRPRRRSPDDTGKVDEDGFAEGDFVGEITEFEAGTSSSGMFDLTPGTSISFCNIVDEEADGTFESHFTEGMQTTLVVE